MKVFRSLAVAAMAIAGAAQAQPLPAQQLVAALQRGGYVIVMRHARAPAEPPAAADLDPANTEHERQLDLAGRTTAAAMGAAIRALRIPVGEVWSSPAFRARQTIALAQLPAAASAVQLGDGGQGMAAAGGDRAAWLRSKAAAVPRSGTDTIIVTHLPNLTAAFDGQAANLADGAALVFHPVAGRPPELVGRVEIEDWPRLAAAAQPKP